MGSTVTATLYGSASAQPSIEANRNSSTILHPVDLNLSALPGLTGGAAWRAVPPADR